MPCLYDNGFQKRNLSSEVVLCLQYSEGTTILPSFTTVILLHGLLEDSLFEGRPFLLLATALFLQFLPPQTTFLQDPFHSFGLADKLPVDWKARNPVCIPLFEDHALRDSISPHGIMHHWLFPARPKVHPITVATSASFALHAWPLELSKANTAISPGKALLKMAMAFSVCFTILSAFHQPSSLFPLPYLMISVTYSFPPSSSQQFNLPWAAQRNSETIIPLPFDFGFSHSVPSFFQLYDALSFALKVLSSCVTRWRRGVFGDNGTWGGSSPLSSYSRKVSKIFY